MILLACSAPDRPDVVLVSLDTTRADALDAAPRISRVAEGGVRFAWALAHAPTTLSSHASVFTGLDPHGHGVVRNGHPLAADVPTLAERFADAGYDTIGIAGSSALDGVTDIDRGFRIWDQVFSIERRARHEAVAEDVTDRALSAVGKRRRSKPLFLFVHYFDAHAPYDAPAPWTRRWGDPGYSGPIDGSGQATTALADAIRDGTADPADVAELRARYRGEVSYVDAEVGRLLDGLGSPILAIFGDHGEMLGETPARPIGHGADVDLVATHVPLVFAGPGVPAGRVVDEVVGLRDVGPTLLALAGIEGGSPSWTGGRDVFLEATQPASDTSERWPNLQLERGVAADGHLLLRAPWLRQGPTLYRVAPGQPAVDDAVRLAELGARLDAWDAAAPRGTEPRPETREALEALGYAE